jgi:uncharacterized membrane protein YesL
MNNTQEKPIKTISDVKKVQSTPQGVEVWCHDVNDMKFLRKNLPFSYFSLSFLFIYASKTTADKAEKILSIITRALIIIISVWFKFSVEQVP